MPYTTPKTDWVTSDGIMNTDLNRIENNSEANHDDTVNNASDIASNLSAITDNSDGISDNSGAIVTNAGNISTNAGNIFTNGGAITTNGGYISTNTGNISTNTTALSPKYRAAGGFNNNTALSTVSTTWKHITKSGFGLWFLMYSNGVSHSSDSFLISNAGLYIGMVSISFNSSNSTDLYLRVYNTTQSASPGYWVRCRSTSATQTVNLVLPLYMHVNANDYIRFEMYADISTNIMVVDANFHFRYTRT